MAEFISPYHALNHPESSLDMPPPPIPKLLYSNEQPLEAEASLIRAAITNAESEIGRLTSILNSRHTQTAYHRRSLYVQFVERQRVIMMPIRRVPPELLSEIFLQYLSLCDNRARRPMLLAHICRAWRAAALSTPQLWNTIPDLDLDGPEGRGGDFNNVLRSYLHWSGDSPLHISLRNTSKALKSHPILDSIFLHVHRWRNITIEVMAASFHAFSEIRGKLRSLQTLKIKLHAEPIAEPMPPSDIFQAAPQLRQVTIEAEGPQDWLMLPWSQITSYSGKVKLSPQVLRAGRRLVECELFADFGPPPIYETLVRETLPFLQSLSLHSDWGSVHSPQLLENLVLPSLNEFRFRGPQFPIGHCISMLSHSGCSLQNLILSTPSLSNNDLAQLLACTPLLAELELDTCGMPWDIALPLVYIPTKAPLVPVLRRLTVRPYHIEEHLLAVIRSRCDDVIQPIPQSYSITPLESARVAFRSSMACRRAHNAFENWSGKNHPESANVVGWHNHLQNVFFGRGTLNEKKMPGIDSIFSKIESYGPIHVENLRLSRLHVLMRRISRSRQDEIPRDGEFKFRERARALVLQWIPSLLEHAKTCSWINEGETDLIYVPSSYPRMHDNDLLMYLAFGRSGDPV